MSVLESCTSRPYYGLLMPLLFLLGVLVTYVSLTLNEWEPVDRSNIGNVKAADFLSYGPIDVVYTWVNGTDPRWKREKEFWHKHWIASLTGQPLPVWGQDADIKGKDDSNSDNRFRDNEELRYSLRSLEKYAPWVRHIYIVTDGQIPSWLNIESPRLSIIKHSDIFANASHLPVFSSPAIEWNLDNIPGLSDMFLYFNDDVFLGSPVRPEDFITQGGVQKGYFAWEIPLCATRCWETSLGNGRCDKECNVTACDYDMGDCGCDVNVVDGTVQCDAEKVASILDHTPVPLKMGHHLCQGMCSYHALGNGICDRTCNSSACAFDGGDCRVVPSLDHHHPRVLSEEEASTLSPLIKTLWSAEVQRNHTLVHVPLHVNATFLNLTAAFGVNGSIFHATHDNPELVRFATVYETDMVVLLVFGRDTNAKPMTSSVQLSLVGADASGTPVMLAVSIVRGNTPMTIGTSPPTRHGLCGGTFTFQNTSVRPYHIRLPFGFRQATIRHFFSSKDVDFNRHNVPEIAESPARVPKASSGETADDFVGKEPLLEVFLPFNLTGKKLHHGDVLHLGWHLTGRLLNDGNDLNWRAYDVCRLQVPKKKGTPSSTGTKEEERVVDGSQEALAANGETIGKQDATWELDEDEDDAETAPCRLTEDERGILVTVRVSTSHDHPVWSDDEAFEGLSFTTTPTASDGTDPAPRIGTDTNPGANGMDATEARPQVMDGQLCFLDIDRADPWRYRYCFALATGQFHATVVEVHQPREQVRAPSSKRQARMSPEENPALLELVDRCLDTTPRYIGMRRQVCYIHEVPVVQGSDQDHAKLAAQQANEQEGMRLACAAQTRRLALREKERQTAHASSGVLDTMRRVFKWMQRAFTLHPVESTSESLDDVAYADVCSPLASTPNTPKVTVVEAQAHLSRDTFGDSLRFVNKLYNRVFGKPKTSERRRVPSHMPFLLQKPILRELKAFWTHEIAATSTHRFRHPQDMQFSFAYFHYLVNRAKLHPPTLQDIWDTYLDANRNAVLDPDEILTAASLAFGNAPPEDFVTTVRTCLAPAKREKVREVATRDGTVRITETLTPHITLAQLAQCPTVADALVQNVRTEPRVEVMPETEVTFHMLSDNYQFAWKQMMGTRARRTKFVCINDDMQFPSPAVSQILHELFLAIWPDRSQFELPPHVKNRYAHLDEYHAAYARRQTAAGLVVGLLLLLAVVYRQELCVLLRLRPSRRWAHGTNESVRVGTTAAGREAKEGKELHDG